MRKPHILVVLSIGLALFAGVTMAIRPSIVTEVLVELGIEPEPPPKVYTVEERLEEMGPAATARVKAYFDAAGAAYPPAAITLVGLKADRVLQLYARSPGADSPWKIVHTYPILAASGHLGPKLKEGDRQVPEGVYGIDLLNPNSKFNVSMRVSYPNAFDKARAAEEGRTNLGGAIMIHGRHSSIGCLAMGDTVSEELFTLAATIGIGNVSVIIAPVDFRTHPHPVVEGAPKWLPDLYTQIDEALKPLPLAAGTAS